VSVVPREPSRYSIRDDREGRAVGESFSAAFGTRIEEERGEYTWHGIW
jgi:hypothetical protein